MHTHTAAPGTAVAEFPLSIRSSTWQPYPGALFIALFRHGFWPDADRRGHRHQPLTERDRHSRKLIGHTRHGNGHLCLPSWGEEPLCIAQSWVSWFAGHRFGVELGTLKLEERNHLQLFSWDRVTPSDRDAGI